jgi:cation-transporting ATPase E
VRSIKIRKKTKDVPENIKLPRIAADFQLGLSSEQAKLRYENGYSNKAVDSPSKSIPQIIAGNLFTYFNLIFAILAVLLILVGSTQLTFLFVVVANTIIGTVQEIRSKLTLDKLTLMSEPRATVVRDGVAQEISTEELVLDDIVIFKAGNQICADAIVLNGEVQVNESLITGEADEIAKKQGDSLYSGSYIVSGTCRARLDKVGADSFASGLTLAAKASKKATQPGMMRSLNTLIKVIGIAIIPIGIFMFYQAITKDGAPFWSTLWENFGLRRAAMESSTAAIIGMIPEGLYLLVSVALAVSVYRLSKRKTLVHDMKCIEALARVDVLCVDKTGTVTENLMKVGGVVPVSHMSEEELNSLIGDFTSNMAADNNTMQSLKLHFGRPIYRTAERVIPFNSTIKCSLVSFGTDETYILGAPEFVLADKYPAFRETVEPYAKSGNRVVLFAKCADSAMTGASRGEVLPLCLILLTNKVRPEAKETFEFFEREGVTVKVISGDNPLTVSDAAKQAGISGWDSYIDATELIDDDLIERAVERYTIFGRVTPEQKKKLVIALKKAGHTVAMTGDGVNDVLALKEADCSIAMASGSDVACSVANLVLLNSDFSCMPEVVREGRRVINNIETAASLFLVKNIFSFVLALLSIFIGFSYPLSPNQLSLVSGITIGMPAFILSQLRNENRIHGKFLRNVISRATPGAITNLILVLGMQLFAFAYPSTVGKDISTLAAIVISFVGLFMVYHACYQMKPFVRNLFVGVVSVILVLGITLPINFLRELFGVDLSTLHFGSTLVLIVFLLLVPSIMQWTKFLIDKLVECTKKLISKISDDQDEKASE